MELIPIDSGREDSGAAVAGSTPSRLLLALIILASTICSLWYASAELNNKNWDEGHSFRNVRSILTTGNWQPTYPFYPALSHLPQAALLGVSQRLHRATGIEVFAALTPKGNLTATSYLVSRWTSIVYGIGVLLMTYRLGRRLFSERTGLLATSVLAISPFFLKASSIYKPDILLMLTALVSFYFAARAAEEGRIGHYLLAGATIGVSAAGKQNGAFASIPLIVATLFEWKAPKRWLFLVGGGLVAVAVFVLFNPWLELLPHYLRMTERYVQWAQAAGAPAPHLVVYAARLLFEWSWHGIAFGAAAWAGLLGLGFVALANRRSWPNQAGETLLVAFVLIYPFACALVSTYPKANIFVATLPFTALAAAWALLAASKWLLAHTPKRMGRVVVGTAAALMVATSVAPYATYLYGVAVPETTQVTSRWIQRNAGFLSQRTIVSEGTVLEVGRGHWNRWPTTPLELEPKRLSDLTSLELDLADYEVFPREALDREDREFYEARMAWIGEAGVHVFDPIAFRRRGPALIVLAHPWRLYRPRGEEAAVSPVEWNRRGKRRLVGNLPMWFNPGQVLSLDLSLTPQQAIECTLVIDGVETPVHLNEKGSERARFMTRKFVVKRQSEQVRIDCPERRLFEPQPTVGALRWVFHRPVATAD